MKVETYLSTRCKDILNLLVLAKEHMTIDEIARIKMVSRRSVYYDLYKINEWLEFYKIPPIEIERGKGIYLTTEQSSRISEMPERTDVRTDYVFSPSERICTQICIIGNATGIIRIEELAEYCQFSRNTIINDLKVAANLLQKYGLKLEYRPSKGYYIQGDAIRRRTVCLHFFHQIVSLYTSGILPPFHMERDQVHDYRERFYAIAGSLGTNYQDDMLFGLISLLPVMKKGTDHLDMKHIVQKDVIDSREYELVARYFPSLTKDEQVYLTIHLLGNQVPAEDVENSPQLYTSACAVVSEFENASDIQFEAEGEVERAIFMHLKTSWVRLAYGIRIDGAPLIQDLVKANINLFEVTKKACGYLESELELPIPDSEIAYLALNFAGYMEQSAAPGETLRILVVCRLGNVSSYMISWEIRAILPGARIVGMVPYQEAFHVKEICDIVISTVPVRSDVQVIMVHPIMTDHEKLTIMHLGTKVVLERQRSVPDVDCREILGVVRKYVPESSWVMLQYDLQNYFDKKQQDRFRLPPRCRGLLQYLSTDKIRLFDGDFSPEEAICLAADPLLQCGSIEESYPNHIINLLNTMGTYMFVIPWLILAHAKPDAGVNRLDVSMGIFKKPVYFSQYRQAKIIILLAPVDKDSHMEIIRDIMTIFALQNRIDDLQHLTTSREVLDKMQEYCSGQQEEELLH